MNNHILSNIDIDIKVDQTQSPHAAAKPKYCILILMLLMLLMFIDKKTQGMRSNWLSPLPSGMKCAATLATIVASALEAHLRRKPNHKSSGEPSAPDDCLDVRSVELVRLDLVSFMQVHGPSISAVRKPKL